MTANLDQWVPVDDIRSVAPGDRTAYDKATTADLDLHRLVMGLPGIFHTMREYEAGNGHRMEPLCLTHGQSPSICGLEDCDVAIPPGHTDRTGQAALLQDRAAKDLTELRKALVIAASQISKAWSIADRYPVEAVIPQEVTEDGPGEGWCLNCYLDGQYFEPVTMQKRRPTEDDPRTEVPVYRDRCKWCGDMKSVHGFEPPVPLLNLHHRRVRITAGMWDEYKRKLPKPGKKGQSGGKRKAQNKWCKEDLVPVGHMSAPTCEDA
jgi:hypothetical protein